MASNHLVDTKIKLGQCNRCAAYVFMAMSSGIRSAADPAPVSRDGFIAALTDGRRLFRLQEAAGRPYKLLGTRPADLHPYFDAGGSQTGAQHLLAEHGCGGHQRNMITFTEIEQGPPSARATPGSSRAGGPPREAAPDAGASPSCPARPASPHRSRPPVCGICDRIIRSGELYTAVECPPGTYAWALHEECDD